MAIKKGKRELINTGTDKRYVKRNEDGTFSESVDVGRSLAADRRGKAKTTVKAGYGDQGDQAKRATKRSTKKTTNKK
ncbi:MAG: hypothetical protein ACR2H4_04915 [Pyrinomonadaceae bacterium]